MNIESFVGSRQIFVILSIDIHKVRPYMLHAQQLVTGFNVLNMEFLHALAEERDCER